MGLTRTWRRLAGPATVAAGVIVSAVGIDVLLSACGGYYPTSPTPPIPDPVVVTVTIRADGVSPNPAAGVRAMVQFVNQDSVSHDVRSNPHPGHTDCLELNVGVIPAGQRVSILNPLDSGRTCGYHDDTQPDDLRFQGTIVSR